MKNLNHTPKASKVHSNLSQFSTLGFRKFANLTFSIYPLSPPDFLLFTGTRLHLNRMLPFWYRAIATKTQNSGLAVACMGPAGGQVLPPSSSRRAPCPALLCHPTTGHRLCSQPPSLLRFITKLSLQSPKGEDPSAHSHQSYLNVKCMGGQGWGAEPV